MSAAKWLMELKTQSEADIRSVSSQKSKYSENSNAGLKLTKTISKSENNKDVCISESVFVRRRGNVLLSLDGVVLPSSELAQESASESPLSVVFKGIDTRSCEAADAEGIARNEEEQNRNEGFVASTSKLEAETQQQNFSGGDDEKCSDILLEVYLGEDEDDEVAYLTSKFATNESITDAMKVDLSATTENPELTKEAADTKP